MTPKFIEVTKKASDEKVMVNPRRMDYFKTMPAPSQQPELNCGTYLSFGRGEFLIVKETVSEIKAKLNK